MQDAFLPTKTEHPNFYLPRREKLIQWIKRRITTALEEWQLIINITFGDSPIIDELQDLLHGDTVRQFSKSSDWFFLKSTFRQKLQPVNSLTRTLICADKWEFNAIYPKKRKMGYPIKELLNRGWSCDIVWISTVECVFMVNYDLRYLADKVRSDIHLRVLGSLSMTFDPHDEWKELSIDEINALYAYYQLPHPIWTN